MDWNGLAHIGPAIVLMLGGAVVAFLGMILRREEGHILPLASLTIVGISAAMLAAAWPGSAWIMPLDAGGAVTSPGMAGAVIRKAFPSDGLAAWASATVLFAAAISLLAAAGSRLHSDKPGEYHALVLLTAAGMLLLSRSGDLLTLLLSLELVSLSTYALCASHRPDPRSGESAMKYFIAGSLGTALLVFGMALFYGATGSLSLAARPLQESYRGLLACGSGLMLAGFLFKAGAAPFHQWVPDVYEGAPTPVTILMAAGIKAAAFAVLARVVVTTLPSSAGPWDSSWAAVLWTSSMLTILVGNAVALRQSSVKRMLAYSGIAHTGYLLIALVGTPGGAESPGRAVAGMLYYLFVYGAAAAGAFGVVSLIRRGGRELETFEDFAGLGRERPAIALCMALFMLSLTGFPPLAGFFAKFAIFRDALARGETALVVTGVLASVVSAAYYLRVIMCMYGSQRRSATHRQSGAAPAVCAGASRPGEISGAMGQTGSAGAATGSAPGAGSGSRPEGDAAASAVQMPLSPAPGGTGAAAGGGRTAGDHASGPDEALDRDAPECSWAAELAIIIPAAAVVVFGVFPGLLGDLISRM
ncbi:MAG: NADH-quinone oxidoreductase subunit N [Planctomycetota bacterium]|nr:NADH-quinone oxidoreductase subunit N [Planctomycetota bacterium]